MRYLTRLSPLSDVHIAGGDRLCAEDLAETRQLRPAAEFRYDARFASGAPEQPLPVVRPPEGGICVTLPHVAADGAERSVRVTIADGVASGPLVAQLYDLGPMRGYRLAGLERPEP